MKEKIVFKYNQIFYMNQIRLNNKNNKIKQMNKVNKYNKRKKQICKFNNKKMIINQQYNKCKINNNN